MNVLFLSSDYPPHLVGGVGTYTYQFAQHLTTRGHHAFVITQTEHSPCEYLEGAVRVWRVRRESIRWLDPVRTRFPKLTERIEYSMAVAQQLRAVMRRFAIDVVESCESRAEGFWHFAFHRRPALLIKLHTPDRVIFQLNQEPLSRDIELLLTLEEWWLRRATHLVGLTQAMTAKVAMLYQFDAARIPRVRVPVETRFFVPDSYAKSENTLQVLYVGRLEFRKGVHVLLRALPRIMHAVPEVRFLFIGQDYGMQPLLDASRRDPRYQSRITWRPHVSREELRSAYQQSHVCVVPSLWENSPAVCLEAMSCGCTVVASQTGGIPELIQDHVNGRLFPPGSSVALARTVIGLLQDHAARTRLAQQARTDIMAKHNLESVFDDTVALYERLCSRKNGHGAA